MTIKITNLFLSLSLALSPVIFAGGDKDTYAPTLPTIQEESSQPKASKKIPAGAVRVFPVVAPAAQPKAQDVKQEQPKSGSMLKGFVKLTVAAGAAMLSYEFFQQGRKKTTLLSTLGLGNSFGDLVQRTYDVYQPRVIKISDANRQLPLTAAQYTASTVLGALALTTAVSGIKDLIK